MPPPPLPPPAENRTSVIISEDCPAHASTTASNVTEQNIQMDQQQQQQQQQQTSANTYHMYSNATEAAIIPTGMMYSLANNNNTPTTNINTNSSSNTVQAMDYLNYPFMDNYLSMDQQFTGNSTSGLYDESQNSCQKEQQQQQSQTTNNVAFRSNIDNCNSGMLVAIGGGNCPINTTGGSASVSSIGSLSAGNSISPHTASVVTSTLTSQCKKCGCICNSEPELQEHIMSVHGGTSSSPYTNSSGYGSSPFIKDELQQQQQQQRTPPVATTSTVTTSQGSTMNSVHTLAAAGNSATDLLDLDSQKLTYPNTSIACPTTTTTVAMPPQQNIAAPSNNLLQSGNSLHPVADALSWSQCPGSEMGFVSYQQTQGLLEDKSVVNYYGQGSIVPQGSVSAGGNTAMLPPTISTTTSGTMTSIAGGGGQDQQVDQVNRVEELPNQQSPGDGGKFEAPTSSGTVSASPASASKAANWKSNEARRPKTYHCTACKKWFTSSGHLKRHYNTTLHKNAVTASGKPDPCLKPISSYHYPSKDPNYKPSKRITNGDNSGSSPSSSSTTSTSSSTTGTPAKKSHKSGKTSTATTKQQPSPGTVSSCEQPTGSHVGKFIGNSGQTHSSSNCPPIPFNQTTSAPSFNPYSSVTVVANESTNMVMSTSNTTTTSSGPAHNHETVLNGHPNGLAGLSVPATMEMPSSEARGLLNITTNTKQKDGNSLKSDAAIMVKAPGNMDVLVPEVCSQRVDQIGAVRVVAAMPKQQETVVALLNNQFRSMNDHFSLGQEAQKLGPQGLVDMQQQQQQQQQTSNNTSIHTTSNSNHHIQSLNTTIELPLPPFMSPPVFQQSVAQVQAVQDTYSHHIPQQLPQQQPLLQQQHPHTLEAPIQHYTTHTDISKPLNSTQPQQNITTIVNNINTTITTTPTPILAMPPPPATIHNTDNLPNMLGNQLQEFHSLQQQQPQPGMQQLSEHTSIQQHQPSTYNSNINPINTSSNSNINLNIPSYHHQQQSPAPISTYHPTTIGSSDHQTSPSEFITLDIYGNMLNAAVSAQQQQTQQNQETTHNNTSSMNTSELFATTNGQILQLISGNTNEIPSSNQTVLISNNIPTNTQTYTVLPSINNGGTSFDGAVNNTNTTTMGSLLVGSNDGVNYSSDSTTSPLQTQGGSQTSYIVMASNTDGGQTSVFITPPSTRESSSSPTEEKEFLRVLNGGGTLPAPIITSPVEGGNNNSTVAAAVTFSSTPVKTRAVEENVTVNNDTADSASFQTSAESSLEAGNTSSNKRSRQSIEDQLDNENFILLSDGRIRCNPCNKEFSRICYFTQHKKSFHSGEYPFRCEKCGKRYQDETLFNNHKTRHSTPSKPFKCEMCPKQFHHKTDLKRHVDGIHTGRKQFICEICLKSFCRNDHMLKHMETHNRIPKERKGRVKDTTGSAAAMESAAQVQSNSNQATAITIPMTETQGQVLPEAVAIPIVSVMVPGSMGQQSVVEYPFDQSIVPVVSNGHYVSL